MQGMTLLAKIRDAAIDSKTDITDVLRQCAVLAARLKHEGFKKWVDQELNGYPPETPLPPYRIIKGVTSIGDFFGPLGEQLKNIPLPLSIVPGELRARVSQVEFREGAGALKTIVVANGEDRLISRWPPDLVALVAGRYYAGRALVAAHIELPSSAVIGVLDAIRNRVLQFVLEIEEQAPDAGEAKPGAEPLITPEQVTQTFNTTILGAANVAVGGQKVSQTAHVSMGDLEGLGKYLTGLGVPTPDVTELEAALKQDGRPNKEGQFGPNISGWIGMMVTKAAEGGWKVAVDVAAAVLASGIRSYYGLP